MATVWSLSHRRPELLTGTTRTGVVREWTHLLVEATEKVENDEAWAQRYAAGRSQEEADLVAAAARSSSAALRDL